MYSRDSRDVQTEEWAILTLFECGLARHKGWEETGWILKDFEERKGWVLKFSLSPLNRNR